MAAASNEPAVEGTYTRVRIAYGEVPNASLHPPHIPDVTVLLEASGDHYALFNGRTHHLLVVPGDIERVTALRTTEHADELRVLMSDETNWQATGSRRVGSITLRWDGKTVRSRVWLAGTRGSGRVVLPAASRPLSQMHECLLRNQEAQGPQHFPRMADPTVPRPPLLGWLRSPGYYLS
eukprot:tig00000204_g17679.t1